MWELVLLLVFFGSNVCSFIAGVLSGWRMRGERHRRVDTVDFTRKRLGA